MNNKIYHFRIHNTIKEIDTRKPFYIECLFLYSKLKITVYSCYLESHYLIFSDANTYEGRYRMFVALNIHEKYGTARDFQTKKLCLS